MRQILEKAIVHLLNEEQDKAEALFHKFMVEKARRIHESLRSGEVVLTEGWDDEITSEEYMAEDDLDSVVDDDDADMMDTDEASDELADDLDVDAEDADMDAEEEDADMVDGDVEDRMTDMESQIEKLTAELDRMMSEIEGGDADMEDEDMEDEDMADDDMADDDMADDDMADDDMEDDDMEDDDMEDEDMADRMENDVTDEDAEDDMADEDVMESKKGKIPPQFLKHIKKSKKDKEEVKEEDEDLDDITESVMAELEKISISMEDGKEVGAGKKIMQNSKSPLIQADVDKRGGARPVVKKGENYTSFDRETAPVTKEMKARKNTVRGKADTTLSPVSTKSEKAKLTKDFAGSKNDKAALDNKEMAARNKPIK